MIPDRDPDVLRLFQHTDLNGETLPSGNVSNKFWEVRAWDLGGRWLWQTRYGRSGTEGQYWPSKNEAATAWCLAVIEEKIWEKCRPRKSGQYVEVKLATVPRANGVAMEYGPDPEVAWLLEGLFKAAGEHIDTYLNATVDQLSVAQISEGRRLLARIQQLADIRDPSLRQTVQQFYRTIPTKIPVGASPDWAVESVCRDYHAMEERLDQLEAAIATITKGSSEVKDATKLLNAKLELLPLDVDWDTVYRMVVTSVVHDQYRRARVEKIYRVRIPDERAAFEQLMAQRPQLLQNEHRLFHASKLHNWRHILHTGLRIPQARVNGWMFGPGIYFAPDSSKSMQYMGHDRLNGCGVMCVAKVALGRMYVADRDMGDKPAGYDSVYGKSGHTKGYSGPLRFDEFTVYSEAQQTMEYVVLVKV